MPLSFELVREDNVTCDICFKNIPKFAELEYEVDDWDRGTVTHYLCFCKPCLEKAVKLFDPEKDNLR